LITISVTDAEEVGESPAARRGVGQLRAVSMLASQLPASSRHAADDLAKTYVTMAFSSGPGVPDVISPA
jgi:hypothetical protein